MSAADTTGMAVTEGERKVTAAVTAVIPDQRQPATDLETQGASGERDRNAITEFMARVVPWPLPGEEGVINMHWTLPSHPGMGGKPFVQLADFLAMVPWVNTHPAFVKDAYYCLSRQRMAGPLKNNRATALRNAANTTHLKAIWADIDANKLPPKGYPNKLVALDAVTKFCVDAGMPPPSAIVDSGNGFHVYWISKRAMTVEEWRPFAAGLWALMQKYGLYGDPVTTDCVRVLRIPETFNHKTAPPKPVVLKRLGDMYDFAVVLKHLPQVSPVQRVMLPSGNVTVSRVMEDPARFPKKPPITDPKEILAYDCQPRELPPLDGMSVIEKCPHYLEALQTGGRAHNQGLWMQTILGTTWFEKGRKLAHALGDQHPGYSRGSTNIMYDRKVQDREDRGLGWPSCKTFENNGSTKCATCQYHRQIKSPLNLGTPAVAISAPHEIIGEAKETEENQIHFYPGNEEICRAALDKIVAADQSTFTSGDALVILRVPDQNKPGMERWSGDLPGTTQALPADIIERAEKLSWMAPTGGKGEERHKRRKPPRDFCTDYITQRRGRYSARPLVGIARVPHMRDDGSIRTGVGYDPETGIFVDHAPELIIPEKPTLDDAKMALLRVLKPFEHYTFEHRENGLQQLFAANLTALERPYMRTSPLFAVNGVQSGTGKGQLCRATGYLALGTVPPFMAWGHDEAEFTKRLDTMLLVSPVMLVIDNCNNRLLRGDTLEMAISEGQATIRQFGKLEGITVQTRTFFMPNGNNIHISGDMSRRSIKINILPRSASPERDTFPFAPENYVIENRASLLNDYYTIMRAFRSAGMPRSGLPTVGSFPEWERKVRDLVWWLTGYDLSEEFDKNKKDDPEQQNDAALLAALGDLFGEHWFKASQADAALKRATDRRRYVVGMTTTSHSPLQNIEDVVERDEADTALDERIKSAGSRDVDHEKGTQLEQAAQAALPAQAAQAAQAAKEDAILEAAEQKFGSKQDYAKTLGNWARGIHSKFIDGFILHRQEDTHTKIQRLRVTLAKSPNAD